MPVALMDRLDGETSSMCGSDSMSPTSWGEDQLGGRVCVRRQRNRDAARRSRKKQTERADVLHEKMQALEQSNAAYVKEIAELKKELQHYTAILNEHEPHCTVLSGLTLPHTASTPSTSASDFQPAVEPNTLPELQFLPSSLPEPAVSLSDLLDRTDWPQWDSMDL